MPCLEPDCTHHGILLARINFLPIPWLRQQRRKKAVLPYKPTLLLQTWTGRSISPVSIYVVTKSSIQSPSLEKPLCLKAESRTPPKLCTEIVVSDANFGLKPGRRMNFKLHLFSRSNRFILFVTITRKINSIVFAYIFISMKLTAIKAPFHIKWFFLLISFIRNLNTQSIQQRELIWWSLWTQTTAFFLLGGNWEKFAILCQSIPMCMRLC